MAGQLAAVLCDATTKLIHTFTDPGDCKVTIRLSSLDNTGVQVKVFHVKQSQPKSDKDLIASYQSIDTEPKVIEDLWTQNKDQIYVDVNTVDKIVVNVNKHKD